MKEYPVVLDEFKTVALLKEGKSIARIGDGEFKCLFGKGYAREPGNEKLAAELRQVLTDPHPNCLVGIPNMDPKGVKYENWLRHRERYTPVLSDKVRYVSAFITRPDNAQWLGNKAYAESIVDLWRGQRVIVIGEPGSKLAAVVGREANVLHLPCPRHEAYKVIGRLEGEVLARPQRKLVILSAGPTATCLANRLTRYGVQALDLGSIGGFIARQLYT